MAAESVDSLVNSSLDSLKINDSSEAPPSQNGMSEVDGEWGFPLEELYRIAVHFFKEKEGTKAIQLSYKDKLRLVALTKQVSYGKYRSDVSPEVGFLDVVGNDRRQAWLSLGDMDRHTAMTTFVDQLDKLCTLFKPYVQAHKAEKAEKERLQQEEEERQRREEEERQRKSLEEEALRQQEELKQKQLQQEMQIRAALNQQTAIQFRQYAEQQHPGNAEQQEVLIQQLQEQHYQQYMQQVYQQQLLHQQQQYQQLAAMQAGAGQPNPPVGQPPAAITMPAIPAPGGNTEITAHATLAASASTPANATPQHLVPSTATLSYQSEGPTHNGHHTMHSLEPVQNSHGEPGNDEGADDTEEHDQNHLPPIAAASMWTRKDLKEFQDSIRKDPESVIKVGSGETVTVRVPTHEDGTCLFWEFATDSYDLGFGVYFEWTIAPSNQVSVHVSESSDEEELDEEEAAAAGETKGDIEKGGSSKKDNRPPTDEIIPVYRRDCHEEVYCGSHMYPGRGVYLLKFDNSYSLWRSKTLYYRVYYTR